MASYSYRNYPVDVSKSDNSHTPELSKTTSSSAKHDGGNRLLRMMYTRATSKSATLGDPTESKDTSFAAFKALPVGSTRVPDGSRYAEPADDLTSATSCKEAVDLIVDAINRACKDIGSASGDDFISEADIVRLVGQYLGCRASSSTLGISVSEAQRTTSIYAKMEYGVKRLLWLGG